MSSSTFPVKEMKVYITAIWYTDCDPFLRIIGNSADKVRKAAEEVMAEQQEKDAEDDDGVFPLASLHWNGIGSMNLKDVIAAYEIPSLEPDYTSLISGDKDALLYLGE